MTKEEWIKKAEEKIVNHLEWIAEVHDMCGSDWSRNRSSMEASQANVKFLQAGIKLMKEKENV